MKEFINPDPIGEYQRICPYCSRQFTANHMHRVFCPENNGEKNYCKNRYKRLYDNHRKQTNPLEDTFNIEEVQLNEHKDKLETDRANQLYNNICLLASQMGNTQTKTIGIQYLQDLGMDYDVYEEICEIPHTNSKVSAWFYGPYALTRYSENKVIITHKTLLKWKI